MLPQLVTIAHQNLDLTNEDQYSTLFNAVKLLCRFVDEEIEEATAHYCVTNGLFDLLHLVLTINNPENKHFKSSLEFNLIACLTNLLQGFGLMNSEFLNSQMHTKLMMLLTQKIVKYIDLESEFH